LLGLFFGNPHKSFSLAAQSFSDNSNKKEHVLTNTLFFIDYLLVNYTSSITAISAASPRRGPVRVTLV
jgi:hypothetical protein